MIHDILVPQLGVNDEFVTIVEWRVNDGDKVEVGTPLCIIETTKAVVDLLAENPGVIVRIRCEKERVAIKDLLGYIGDSWEEIQRLIPEKQATGKKSVGGEADIKATQKARALAESLGVDIGLILKKGIIREKDVQEFYASRQKEF